MSPRISTTTFIPASHVVTNGKPVDTSVRMWLCKPHQARVNAVDVHLVDADVRGRRLRGVGRCERFDARALEMRGRIDAPRSPCRALFSSPASPTSYQYSSRAPTVGAAIAPSGGCALTRGSECGKRSDLRAQAVLTRARFERRDRTRARVLGPRRRRRCRAAGATIVRSLADRFCGERRATGATRSAPSGYSADISRTARRQKCNRRHTALSSDDRRTPQMLAIAETCVRASYGEPVGTATLRL